MNIWLGFK